MHYTGDLNFPQTILPSSYMAPRSLHKHAQHIAFALALITLFWPHRARRGEEKHLDRNGKASVQHHDNDEQNLTRLGLCCAEHWVQVAQQERCAKRQTESRKDVVEYYHALLLDGKFAKQQRKNEAK